MLKEIIVGAAGALVATLAIVRCQSVHGLVHDLRRSERA